LLSIPFGHATVTLQASLIEVKNSKSQKAPGIEAF